MGSRGSFPEDKSTGAWSWPLASIYCRDQEIVELYLHSQNTPLCRGTQFKRRDKFTFTLPLILSHDMFSHHSKQYLIISSPNMSP
jgi:hypothetical protein